MTFEELLAQQEKRRSPTTPVIIVQQHIKAGYDAGVVRAYEEFNSMTVDDHQEAVFAGLCDILLTERVNIVANHPTHAAFLQLKLQTMVNKAIQVVFEVNLDRLKTVENAKSKPTN